MIEAQSVKAAASVPAASRGFDGAKKVNGRKRHILVDALGLLLTVMVTAASAGPRGPAGGPGGGAGSNPVIPTMLFAGRRPFSHPWEGGLSRVPGRGGRSRAGRPARPSARLHRVRERRS
ncbi:transposase [Streptomyces fradiae]|uniref:transposase n=1 Tax=Streptomyces fradiae TaxID=1906 RepID=UPI003515F303